MDPFHISSSVVPSTRQLQDLKDHIISMEEEKHHREEKFISMKDSILRRYMELEEEPETEFERFVRLDFTFTLLLEADKKLVLVAMGKYWEFEGKL